MLTVVLPRWAEPTVIHLTQENLQRELRQVNGAELLVTDDWGEGIAKCRTELICLVEPDCLVNSGYFSSMTGLFKKNPNFRQLGVMASATAVKQWHDKVYGYELGETWSGRKQDIQVKQPCVEPVRDKKSTKPYNQGIAFIPGAVIRTSTLKRIIDDKVLEFNWQADLVYFSTMFSLEVWRHKCYMSLNPNTTYVTTEDYVGRQAKFDPQAGELAGRFKSETFRIDK